MSDNTKISAYSAVLEFFSSRAEAHASFFLASLFGLFTVLSIAKNTSNWLWWSITYWFLFGLGLYTFFNFCTFAQFAHIAYQQITKMAEIYEEVESEKKDLYKRDFVLRNFSDLKNLIGRAHAWRIIIFGILYFIVVLIPYCLVFCACVRA